MNIKTDNYYFKKINKKQKFAVLFSFLTGAITWIIGYLVSHNDNQFTFFFGLAILLMLTVYFLAFKEIRIWKRIFRTKFPPAFRKVLIDKIQFYNALNPVERDYFEQRIQYFLATKTITGVQCEITDQDRIYISASAIMPVFSFRDFFYNNINEILVYPDSFDENYNISSPTERERIAGMVGNGVMNKMMILSKKDLNRAFDDRINANNVAIHEFVHLIDMADGTIDGVPNVLLDRSFTIPWVAQMHREMIKITERHSDLDPYAITNDAEFLSVVSEYFFDTPEKFEEKHPILYDSMCQIFQYSK
jgi:Mlc titration factor MtfA (ptsG expression regulator)